MKFKRTFRAERLSHCPTTSTTVYSDAGLHQLDIYSFGNYLLPPTAHTPLRCRHCFNHVIISLGCTVEN